MFHTDPITAATNFSKITRARFRIAQLSNPQMYDILRCLEEHKLSLAYAIAGPQPPR
uniref:Uncharacterized protein n=1 Tax=Arundo donax TaxID=35708 RepID=A0A0A9FHV9_ARUDO